MEHGTLGSEHRMVSIFGALFRLFNRWTLYVTLISHLDFVPLVLPLSSLRVLPRRFPLACVLFGLSLAIEQIAFFALPLYLIWSCGTQRQHRIRHPLLGLTYALALFRSVPLYASNLLVMTVLFGFNSVLFRQYTVWLLPFIPLTLVEIPCVGRGSARKQDSVL